MMINYVPIPGISTFRLSGPQVKVLGDIDTNISLVLTYRFCEGSDEAGGDVGPMHEMVGELFFRTVFEYRFVDSAVEYKDVQYVYPRLASDTEPEFGLSEILASPYVERMLSLNSRFPGWLGGRIRDSDIKHYRISWDEYGTFEIIALGVETRQYEAPRD